jgi:hypothetical protein
VFLCSTTFVAPYFALVHPDLCSIQMKAFVIHRHPMQSLYCNELYPCKIYTEYLSFAAGYDITFCATSNWQLVTLTVLGLTTTKIMPLMQLKTYCCWSSLYRFGFDYIENTLSNSSHTVLYLLVVANMFSLRSCVTTASSPCSTIPALKPSCHNTMNTSL